MNEDAIKKILASPAGRLNEHLKEVVTKKKHKYGAVKTEIDGIMFASGREAGRYCKLRGFLVLGLIKDLRLQVPYELNEGGMFSFIYIADFVYIDTETGAEVVEDAKGYKTPEYRKKKKLMLKIHGITIKET